MTNKEKFKKSLDSIYQELCNVNDWMYENPELGFEEYKTSKYLVEFIEKYSERIQNWLLNSSDKINETITFFTKF